MDTNEERQRFEVWAEKRKSHLDMLVDGRYKSPYTQLAWLAWQYRANLGLGTSAWQARASQEPRPPLAVCVRCAKEIREHSDIESRPASGELRERAQAFMDDLSKKNAALYAGKVEVWKSEIVDWLAAFAASECGGHSTPENEKQYGTCDLDSAAHQENEFATHRCVNWKPLESGKEGETE